MIKRKFKYFLFLFVFCHCFLIFSYEGEDEVEGVFSKIKDLHNPTLEEYKQIQEFLRFGKRAYLAPFSLSKATISSISTSQSMGKAQFDRRTGRFLQLVGDQGEMPIFEIDKFTATSQSKNCVLLYSSYNSFYPKMLDQLHIELRKKGFQGDILMRKGGFPYMSKGGIKLCHIPYAWKVAFIKEAIELGYEKILWIDISMKPLKNLQDLFTLLEEKGYLFFTGGTNLDYGYQFGHHTPQAMQALKISTDDLAQIPHLATCVIGFNVKNPKGMKVLSEWFEETKKVEPCITYYPEELPLSVVAWRNGLPPLMPFGLVTCTVHNFHHKEHFPLWNFLLDLDHVNVSVDAAPAKEKAQVEAIQP